MFSFGRAVRKIVLYPTAVFTPLDNISFRFPPRVRSSRHTGTAEAATPPPFSLFFMIFHRVFSFYTPAPPSLQFVHDVLDRRAVKTGPRSAFRIGVRNILPVRLASSGPLAQFRLMPLNIRRGREAIYENPVTLSTVALPRWRLYRGDMSKSHTQGWAVSYLLISKIRILYLVSRNIILIHLSCIVY